MVRGGCWGSRLCISDEQEWEDDSVELQHQQKKLDSRPQQGTGQRKAVASERPHRLSSYHHRL